MSPAPDRACLDSAEPKTATAAPLAEFPDLLFGYRDTPSGVRTTDPESSAPAFDSDEMLSVSGPIRSRRLTAAGDLALQRGVVRAREDSNL